MVNTEHYDCISECFDIWGCSLRGPRLVVSAYLFDLFSGDEKHRCLLDSIIDRYVNFFFQDYLLKGYHNIAVGATWSHPKQTPPIHKGVQTVLKFHLSKTKETVGWYFKSISINVACPGLWKDTSARWLDVTALFTSRCMLVMERGRGRGV